MNGFGDWIGGDAETPDTSKVTSTVESAGKDNIAITGGKLDFYGVNIDLENENVSQMLPAASEVPGLIDSLKEQLYTDGKNNAFREAMNQPVSDEATKAGAEGSAAVVGNAIDKAMETIGNDGDEYKGILDAVKNFSDTLSSISTGESEVTQGEAMTIMLATDLAKDVVNMVQTDGAGNMTGFNSDEVGKDEVDSLLASIQLISDFSSKIDQSPLTESINSLMDAMDSYLKDNI